MTNIVKFKNSFSIMDELREFEKELDAVQDSFISDLQTNGLIKFHIMTLLITTLHSKNVPLSEKKFAADILSKHSEVYRFCNEVYTEWGEANKLNNGRDL